VSAFPGNAQHRLCNPVLEGPVLLAPRAEIQDPELAMMCALSKGLRLASRSRETLGYFGPAMGQRSPWRSSKVGRQGKRQGRSLRNSLPGFQAG
jgi:hypothetical protein